MVEYHMARKKKGATRKEREKKGKRRFKKSCQGKPKQ